MADNSLITQEQYNEDMKRLYDEKIYPYLNGATHTGCVPVGSRLDGWFPTTPKYYLYCDGAEYLKSDYPELAELLAQVDDINSTTLYVGSDANHFKVPDLRGEFIRGTGSNSHTNQGSGANIGVHQDATEIPLAFGTDAIYAARQNTGVPNNVDSSINIPTGKMKNTIGTAISEFNAGATDKNYTSRPTNTSLPQYICYKTHYIDLALDSFPISISNPTDGQALVWNATEGRWKNAGVLHEYSTEERVVGKWIDGRPIYEKTITGSLAASSSNDKFQIYNVQTIELINAHGFASFSGQKYIINLADSDNYIIYLRQETTGELSIIKRKFTACDYYITIQYTKTTDTV